MENGKITLATFKKFIKQNYTDLLINVKSSFDGSTDCVERLHDGFKKATTDKTVSKNTSYHDATLGINGVWLVRGSRDFFNSFENETLKGIEVSNCCGTFIVAITK
jgi:hypothetical protein